LTWFITALGAGLGFFFRTINRKLLDAKPWFAAGAMIAVVVEKLIPES
jgi:zinc transporter ZupT